MVAQSIEDNSCLRAAHKTSAAQFFWPINLGFLSHIMKNS